MKRTLRTQAGSLEKPLLDYDRLKLFWVEVQTPTAGVGVDMVYHLGMEEELYDKYNEFIPELPFKMTNEELGYKLTALTIHAPSMVSRIPVSGQCYVCGKVRIHVPPKTLVKGKTPAAEDILENIVEKLRFLDLW